MKIRRINKLVFYFNVTYEINPLFIHKIEYGIASSLNLRYKSAFNNDIILNQKTQVCEILRQ